MIYDISAFTTLDYPNKLACIIWLVGCNLRCKYCYNSKMIFAKKANVSDEDFCEFLKNRVGLLDGVVFSGGECSVNKNLIKYVKIAKDLGFLVKIDTNASNPDIIKHLLSEKLVDYVALDFKATKEKYYKICAYDYYKEFKQCLKLLLNSNIDYEVRTTWHYDLLSVDDILHMNKILRKLGYKKKYYLQKFFPAENFSNLKESNKEIDLSLLNDDFELRFFN